MFARFKQLLIENGNALRPVPHIRFGLDFVQSELTFLDRPTFQSARKLQTRALPHVRRPTSGCK